MEKFKNRKEIEGYFKGEVFKFTYMSDGMISFETLNPHMVDDVLYDFELVFYYEDFTSFFAYSSLTQWLDSLQISEVNIRESGSEVKTELYFEKYV